MPDRFHYVDLKKLREQFRPLVAALLHKGLSHDTSVKAASGWKKAPETLSRTPMIHHHGMNPSVTSTTSNMASRGLLSNESSIVYALGNETDSSRMVRMSEFSTLVSCLVVPTWTLLFIIESR